MPTLQSGGASLYVAKTEIGQCHGMAPGTLSGLPPTPDISRHAYVHEAHNHDAQACAREPNIIQLWRPSHTVEHLEPCLITSNMSKDVAVG